MKEKHKKGINSSLSHHKRDGKKLITPFNQIPKIQKTSWTSYTLPEMLWCVLLMSSMERTEAICLVKKFINTITKKVQLNDAALSSIANIPKDIFDSAMSVICRNKTAVRALRPLVMFKHLPGLSLWMDHLKKPRKQVDFRFLEKAVFMAYHHQTDIATDCRWARIYAKVSSRLLSFSEGMESFVMAIVNYEKYCNDKDHKAHIRALEGTYNCEEWYDAEWVNHFWQYSFVSTSCVSIDREIDKMPLSNEDAIIEQTKDIYEELAKHFMHTITTTDIDSRHDTTFGISTYAIMIIYELAYSAMFTSIIGRFAIRTIVESLILIKYLSLVDQKKLWDEYRAYGNGQAKLQLLKVDDDDKYTFIMKENLKVLANEDYWQEFLDINVGKLFDTDVRWMASRPGMEDMKDVYDKYYNISSTYIHAQWCAVKYSSLINCYNPLHRFHRIPSPRLRIHEDVSVIACELCNKILDVVSNNYPSLKLRYSLNV